MSTTTRAHHPFETLNAADFSFTRRAWVDAAPARVYDLVSDVSAIRRWSPNATDVAFDQGAGPRVGAWFSGSNHRDGKQWTTRSQIVRADPGTAFTFVVGGAEDGIVRWGWTFLPQGRGTVVQQSWQLLRLDPVLGTTRGDLDALRDYMADSAETTLASLAQWIAEERHPDTSRSEAHNPQCIRAPLVATPLYCAHLAVAESLQGVGSLSLCVHSEAFAPPGSMTCVGRSTAVRGNTG
ncbi:SRPBCC family protein [Streptomyces goshikiensis]|uniref:SRPBCC family protein n=1 Tax=Streptomyces goshikiensis TaxID=1942 RepID=UPI0036A9C938